MVCCGWVTRFPTFDAQRLNPEIRVTRNRILCGSVFRFTWHFNSNLQFFSSLLERVRLRG